MIFEKELEKINNITLRNIVAGYLEEQVPEYFYEIGASSSGKYHPAFSQGEGGLIRHTKAVVMFAEELLRLNSYAYMKEIYKDYVIAACLIHDTCKYGIYEYDKTEYENHGENAAYLFENYALSNWHYQPSELLLDAVRRHMGQWGQDKPFTNIDRCVHYADYFASRNFIDIPLLSAENLS